MGRLLRIPSPEELTAGAEERTRRIRELAGWHEPERFCPISLGDWLTLCREAGAPHVPAERVAEFLREDYLSFDTRGEHEERLLAVHREILAAAREGRHMMRLDCCASSEIKYRMASGKPGWREGFQEIEIGDPRGFDIVFEYPRESVPVWQRPWVEAMRELDYPVEYRAYVRDGELLGISSYYPQRPLGEHPEHLEAVREAVEKLTSHVEPPFLWHCVSALDGTQLDLAGVHFTADFIVSEYGEVLFLEGGPPHELGAHPCCFRAHEIGGVALTDRNLEE